VAVRVNLSEKMIAHKKTAFRRFFYALSEITWQQMQQVRQLQAQKQQLQPQVRRLVLVLVQQQELVLEQVLQLFSHRKRPEQQQQPELPKREICSYHYP
jgi:hypothetical protein